MTENYDNCPICGNLIFPQMERYKFVKLDDDEKYSAVHDNCMKDNNCIMDNEVNDNKEISPYSLETCCICNKAINVGDDYISYSDSSVTEILNIDGCIDMHKGCFENFKCKIAVETSLVKDIINHNMSNLI